MKESNRTLVYVVVAVAAAGLAFTVRYATQPAPLEEFANVGEPFYPDFEDPNAAKSLSVVAFNEDTASIKEFRVEFKDGLWRIPSHHDYPADAEDRLSNTAASVIGIERGTLVGRRESDFERFGVLDPLNEDATQLKGRGQRVTLTKENGEVLADYIIGKKYETPTPGTDEEDMYYVRLPKEKETYRTRLEIDLSTKFADWIEADLLQVQREDLREIMINKYSIDEVQRKIVDEEVSRLTRDKSFDPWNLEGLDEATEEVDTTKTQELVSNLDDLKIVGVRPKPQGLGADLKVDQSVIKSQLQLDMLVTNMADKGFLVLPGNEGKPQLVSNEGELVAATDKGVVYTLRFGEIFTGSEFEIEVGSTESDGEETVEDIEAGAQDEETADGKEADGKSPQNDLKRSRYLFVSADFDQKHVGDPPQKPEEPAKPAEEPSESADEPDSEEQATSNGESADSNGTGDADEEHAGDGEKPSGDEENKQTDKDAEYAAARQKYEQDLKQYETDLKEYEEKLEEGKQKAKELNDRFAEWYYVISAESFENLRLSRSELVKPKEQEAAEDSNAPADQPADSAAETPAEKPATESAAPIEEPPAPKEPTTGDASADETSEAGEPETAAEPQDEPAAEAEQPTPGEEPAAPDTPAAESPEP